MADPQSPTARLRDPAVYRLAVYIVVGIAGIVLVAVGVVEAADLSEWVGSTATQAGGLLALVSGLAAKNIDRTGAPDVAVEVDGRELAEAVAPVVIEVVGDTVRDAVDRFAGGGESAAEARQRAEDMLAAMRARIDAARGGEHRAEG